MAYSLRKKHLIGLAALAIVALYVLASLQLLVLPGTAYLLPFLALGPLGMVGSLELGRFLADGQPDIATRAGSTFGVVAFAIWEVVVAVQNGTRSLWREFIVPDLQSALDGGLVTVRLLYRGVNAVQATADVAFDIFYCLAIILFSALMWKDPRFGKLVAGFGLLSAGGLLLLNLWTFPRPPAEAGLVDLGPGTGIWWIAVILIWVRAEARQVNRHAA